MEWEWESDVQCRALILSLCMTLNVSALGLVGSGSPDNMQEPAWLAQFDIQCNAWESDVQCRALILSMCMTLNASAGSPDNMAPYRLWGAAEEECTVGLQ